MSKRTQVIIISIVGSIFLLFFYFYSYRQQIVEEVVWADGRVAKGCYHKLFLGVLGDKVFLIQNYHLYLFPADKKGYGGILKMAKVDINKDGKDEYVLAVQLEGVKWVYPDGKFSDAPEMPEAVVLICEHRGNQLKIEIPILVGGIDPDFQLVDLNKDGTKDVVASGKDLPIWSYLKIVSWQRNKYRYLWNSGENCSVVEQNFKINKDGNAQIKIGLPSSSDSSTPVKVDLWETWIWDGQKFAKKME